MIDTTTKIGLLASRLVEAFKTGGKPHVEKVAAIILVDAKAWELRAVRELFQEELKRLAGRGDDPGGR